MKKWAIYPAVVFTIVGLAYWRDRAYKASHTNGTQVKIECPQQDGVPSPCILHVAMPDIDRAFRIDSFRVGRNREAIIIQMEYSGATIHGTQESELLYKWKYQDAYPALVSEVRLERGNEVLAKAKIP